MTRIVITGAGNGIRAATTRYLPTRRADIVAVDLGRRGSGARGGRLRVRLRSQCSRSR